MSGHVFHLIPHTHWDREWYLPEPAFRVRLVRMMDDLLARLAADPAYRSFLLDGQTVLLEDYLRVRPEREAEIRALAAAGRIQVGPWYVLADELLPSGESLVRNLLKGAADAERLGVRLDVGYSPDAFGHPAILPVLLRGFGLQYAVLWRGVPTADPSGDWYRWRAPPGSDVMLYHLPPVGYEMGADLPVDREPLKTRWEAIRATLLPRSRSRHVPVMVGADHHAAHPDLVKVRELLAGLYPDDAFRISRLDECLAAAVTESAALPALEGELRSSGDAWALQGVHSTRMPIKQANARLELWLERVVEPLAALARRSGGADHRAVLDTAWRTLLQNQFHDSLGGCHADPVTQTMWGRFAAVESLARETARAAIQHLVGHDPDAPRAPHAPATEAALVLWNGAARPRGGVVAADVAWFREDVLVGPPGGRTPRRAPPPRALELTDGQGHRLPVQVLDRVPGTHRLDAFRHYPDDDRVEVWRIATVVPQVPGVGFQVIRVRAAATGTHARPAVGAQVSGRTLRNREVEVAVRGDGTLELRDRVVGARFRGLVALEDGGDVGDTYTYCPPARDRLARGVTGVRVRRVAAGPLVAALEVTARLRTRVPMPIRLTVALHADSPVVRIFLEVENRARDHRLRIAFPTGLPGVEAVAGGPFGPVRRGVAEQGRTPIETLVATAPHHRHVTVAAAERGLSVLTLGAPEYELAPDGTVRITLLRGVGELSRADLATRPGHAGWPTPTPGAQCLGRHRFEFGLVMQGMKDGGGRWRMVEELWEEAFLPIKGFFLRDALELRLPPAGVTLEGRGLVFSAMKPAEVGGTTVLRCYNALDVPVHGAWRFADGVRSAYRARLDERETTPMVLEERGRVLRFTAGAREMVTVMVS